MSRSHDEPRTSSAERCRERITFGHLSAEEARHVAFAGDAVTEPLGRTAADTRGKRAAGDVDGDDGRVIETKACGGSARGQDLWTEDRQVAEAESDPNFLVSVVDNVRQGDPAGRRGVAPVPPSIRVPGTPVVGERTYTPADQLWTVRRDRPRLHMSLVLWNGRAVSRDLVTGRDGHVFAQRRPSHDGDNTLHGHQVRVVTSRDLPIPTGRHRTCWTSRTSRWPIV
jgi:hypothetical protein